MFNIHTLVLGMVETNTYILENNGEALIIDPEDDAGYILEQCASLHVNPAAVLLTHGHFDHIGAVNGLKEALKLPVYAGAAEKDFLLQPSYNGSAKFGRTQVSVKADVLLADGELLNLAGINIKVITTPGHTDGSVCYYIESENALFTGDTLFADSYGRTDFPGGSQENLTASITKKLFALPPETTVYAGHGGTTTICHEKKYNPINKQA